MHKLSSHWPKERKKELHCNSPIYRSSASTSSLHDSLSWNLSLLLYTTSLLLFTMTHYDYIRFTSIYYISSLGIYLFSQVRHLVELSRVHPRNLPATAEASQQRSFSMASSLWLQALAQITLLHFFWKTLPQCAQQVGAKMAVQPLRRQSDA